MIFLVFSILSRQKTWQPEEMTEAVSKYRALTREYQNRSDEISRFINRFKDNQLDSDVKKKAEAVEKRKHDLSNACDEENRKFQFLINNLEDIADSYSMVKEHGEFSPVDLSLIKIETDKETKTLDLLDRIEVKLFAQAIPATLPLTKDGYCANGHNGSFLFRTHHISKITTVKINPPTTKNNIKTFYLELSLRNGKLFQTDRFSLPQAFSEPITFDLKSSYWVRLIKLVVVDTYGHSDICLAKLTPYESPKFKMPKNDLN